ncbi:RNA 2',3'-cyclic phosphodiesterase [Sphingobium sp.]|uniref:RNA 2',3'-cyclic phosphodiesterase n=1 Tax=Sphingobium sp. TaxID=1912891 RepID=UPI002E22CA5E
MHRLFVAIRPPADQRAFLLGHMGGVDNARWQDDTQLHLTLRFVGEVERRRAEDLADALTTIRFAPFAIHLSGVGRFERRHVVDTLWAGVQPRDGLEALHKKIDRLCVSIGLPPESRAYLPHVTLARFGRFGGAVEPFLARHAGLAGTPFLVDRFTLYESRTGHAGATYHAVEDYPADGTPR